MAKKRGKGWPNRSDYPDDSFRHSQSAKGIKNAPGKIGKIGRNQGVGHKGLGLVSSGLKKKAYWLLVDGEIDELKKLLRECNAEERKELKELEAHLVERELALLQAEKPTSYSVPFPKLDTTVPVPLSPSEERIERMRIRAEAQEGIVVRQQQEEFGRLSRKHRDKQLRLARAAKTRMEKLRRGTRVETGELVEKDKNLLRRLFPRALIEVAPGDVVDKFTPSGVKTTIESRTIFVWDEDDLTKAEIGALERLQKEGKLKMERSEGKWQLYPPKHPEDISKIDVAMPGFQEAIRRADKVKAKKPKSERDKRIDRMFDKDKRRRQKK